MEIRNLQKDSLAIAMANGFCIGPVNVGTQLMLIVSELGEALEHYRDGNGGYPLNEVWYNYTKPDGFAVELADAMIRIAQLAEQEGINLESAITQKQNYNKTRPYKHGGKLV